MFVLRRADARLVRLDQYALDLHGDPSVPILEVSPVTMGRDTAPEKFRQLVCGSGLPKLPQLPATGGQGQGGQLLHAVHGPVEAAPVEVVFILFQEGGQGPLHAVQLGGLDQHTDPAADARCGDALRMLPGAFRLQHPHSGMLRRAAEGHIAVPPVLRISG